MTREKFWSVVAEANGSEADLERALASLDPAEILSFQAHFDEFHAQAYRWDLWGAAYIMEGGCSDDGFTDFRYGLIALGRRRFEAALSDPDSLSSADDMVPNELFGYAASKAYERAAGREMPLGPPREPTDPSGERWNFEDEIENGRRLPHLTQKYSRS